MEWQLYSQKIWMMSEKVSIDQQEIKLLLTLAIIVMAIRKEL
jgi:hypothetical protein